MEPSLGATALRLATEESPISKSFPNRTTGPDSNCRVSSAYGTPEDAGRPSETDGSGVWSWESLESHSILVWREETVIIRWHQVKWLQESLGGSCGLTSGQLP